MKTKYLFMAAIGALTLVSCADESFVGDQEALNAAAQADGAIKFVSSTPSMTRAAGATAAANLEYKFKVYGVKKVGDDYSNVFAGDAFSSAADYNADPKAYWVWYNASTAGTTTSNTSDWDYVGAAGSHGTSSYEASLTAEQTIKYWDYSATQYEFVAYSATEGSPTISKYQKGGFTVVATPAQLAGLYIADKLTISDKNGSPTKPASGFNQIGNIVQFTFRSAAAKVRLGIYETIPGYVVKNVNFRPNAAEFAATKDNAKLSGSFNGTSASGSETFNVTYNSTTGIAELDNTGSAGSYFDFGTFASQTTDVGTTSTSPMWANGSADYQNVFPNTDNVGNMILYVDYDLYNATSGETIKVKAAKAVVPSMYMKWNPNYAYTYLFKISDNTNGTTGTEGSSPEGLYPITFDALTVAATDGQEVGTITTVSTPAITTYQNGSVSATGITYANANGLIYITVNTSGTVETLTDKIKLYTVAAGTTEADLMLTTKTKTAVAGGASDALSILDADAKVQDITFTSAKAAKFTPTADITYAVRFLVSAGSATATTENYDPDATYYSMTPDADGFYTVVSPIPSEDLNGAGDAWKDAAAKAKYTTSPTQPVYQYKIIIVAPAAP